MNTATLNAGLHVYEFRFSGYVPMPHTAGEGAIADANKQAHNYRPRDGVVSGYDRSHMSHIGS